MSDRTEFDRLDHLPAIGLGFLHNWNLAVAKQADRVLRENAGALDAQADGYLFVLALRQVLRAAHLVRETIDEPSAGRVAAAIDAFDESVPDAKNARDVLDHFDDYARGLGDLAHPGVKRSKRAPTSEAAAKYAIFYERGCEGRFVLHFGDLVIDVAAARDAAAALQQSVYGEVYESADEDEVFRSLGDVSSNNLPIVGTAFYGALGGSDLTADVLEDLRARVTPESLASWGDFSGVRAYVDGYALASNPIMASDDVGYMKLVPDPGYTSRLNREVFLPEVQFITLQRRPDLDGGWYVHAVGALVKPGDMPMPSQR